MLLNIFYCFIYLYSFLIETIIIWKDATINEEIALSFIDHIAFSETWYIIFLKFQIYNFLYSFLNFNFQIIIL